MARADVARIDRVVIKVFAVEVACFVADEAVFGHCLRVELNLDFDVLCDGEECGGGFIHQHLAGLVQRVDISGDAVPVLGEGLHGLVIVVALTEAENREENSGVAFALDEILQFLGVGDAHVEIAVGGEDHAVDGALVEVLLGELIGKVDAFRPGGGAARAEIIERGDDFCLIADFCRLENRSRRACIDHNGHGIVRF